MRAIALVAAAVAAFASPALAKAPAIERTEGFVADLMKVKQDDGKLSAADKAANQKVFARIDGYFDYDRLTNESIVPIAAKFTPEQKAEFLRKLKELIRLIAYPDSGAWFRRAKFTFIGPKEEGDLATVTVDANLPKEDLQTKVDLHWRKTAGGLKLVDVSFDGDSIVKDYQNQFARIVDKEGVKGLLERVDKRRAELEAPPKGK